MNGQVYWNYQKIKQTLNASIKIRLYFIVLNCPIIFLSIIGNSLITHYSFPTRLITTLHDDDNEEGGAVVSQQQHYLCLRSFPSVCPLHSFFRRVFSPMKTSQLLQPGRQTPESSNVSY